MKSPLVKLHKAVLAYVAWGWPLLLIDGALRAWLGDSDSGWRALLNDGGFAWILCAAVGLVTLVVDKERRELLTTKLFGIREGDERERSVTGDAARTTLLLSLAFQLVLLVLTLTSVQLVWNSTAPKGTPHGLLSVGFSFSSARHLDVFDAAPPRAPAVPAEPGRVLFDGYVLSPSSFPILLALILLQLAVFKAFSRRRYEGVDA
jgi:hypothetical protein